MILTNDAIAVLDEVKEQIEDLRTDINRLRASAEFSPVRIEHEVIEQELHVLRCLDETAGEFKRKFKLAAKPSRRLVHTIESMKIVVIGGSGLIGSKLVEGLQGDGHDAVAASVSTSVDVMDGADIVVDLTNVPSLAGNAVVASSEMDRCDLIEAPVAARVKHHVMLSVVGVERNAATDYFGSKLDRERRVTNSGLPYTIVRSTQFYDSIRYIAERGTDGDAVHVSPALVQPIASDDVVAVVADIALGTPMNRTMEIAGPQRVPLDEMVREYLLASGDARAVIGDVHARYLGLELNDKSLMPADTAHIGLTRFAEWLKGEKI